MRSIVLAAGKGERLKSLTNNPKCLLNIAGETILERTLPMLPKPTVVVGYKKEKVIEEAKRVLGYKVDFCYNPMWNTTNTLVSFLFAAASADEDVLLVNGDVVFDLGLVEDLTLYNFSTCATQDIPQPTDEEVKVLIKNNFVKQIGKSVRSNTEAVGVYFFKHQMVKEICDTVASLSMYPNNLYYEDVLDKCLHLPLLPVLTDRAVEIDTPADYERAVKIYGL